MLRKFGGPLAIPIVGNCYQAEALYLLRYLGKLRKRFGKLFTFFAFTKPYLVVCEPLVVRRVLSDTKTFSKGADYTTQFSYCFGQGLVTSNGQKHKDDRACFGKYFIRSNICKYMSMVNKMTAEAILTLLPPNTKNPEGAVQNMEEFFALLALRVFMSFSIAFDYRERPEREKEICHIVSKGSWAMGRMISLGIYLTSISILSNLSICPIFLGLPMWEVFPPMKYLKSVRGEVWKDMKDVVQARRDAISREDPTALEVDDCLTAMIKDNLSDKDMIDHMVTLISAGHDTTAFFSSYLCLLLAQHEDCQEKLRSEINSQLGSRTEITADDVTEMKYLQKVMQETLRLYAIIPCVTRYCTEEVHIKEANVTIPMGANLLIPMFLINRDPDIWEKPSEFDPDRFEGKGNEFTSAKLGFFPFGYGSRTCIGNTLAQMESAVFICLLLRRFRLQEEPGFKPAIFAGISLTTSNGINVILKDL